MAHGLGLLVGMDAQQVHNLNLGVVTIGRQEVDAAALGLGLVTDGLQLLHRRRVGHAHLGGHVGHTVDRAIPHDVLDIDIIPDQGLHVVVDVDDAYQAIALLTEVVEERRVLTERIISVVGIIAWRLIVAKE